MTIDATATTPGRGAWVCRSEACVSRGVRTDRLAHAFRKPCRVPANLEQTLRTMTTGDALVARPVE